ncbi:MFS superfamily sulfate permease-like transporter [Catenulispora sp. EB89]|uniref:hypothetical protein n=1 Tax=Catenulispora sp. EB89 TaxID=3156257 RepID=UPI003516F162
MNATLTGLPKSIRYLLGGVMIGLFWYLNRHRPPWEEALRTIVVFAVLMAALKAKVRSAGIDIHLIPLVVSKAAVVVAAAVVEQVLEHSMRASSDVPLFVALGLAATVAVLGPFGDSHYFTVAAEAQTSTEPPSTGTIAPEA